MKTIFIHDPNHRFIADVIVDDEDYVFLHQYKWRLQNGEAIRYMHNDMTGTIIPMLEDVARCAGMPSNKDIEHISNDRLDNRRENLRVIEPTPTGEYRTILLLRPADLDQIIGGTIVDYEDFAYLDKWTWRLHRSYNEAVREEDGKFIFMRDAIWRRAGHQGPVEHISANKLDNRRSNLHWKTARKPEPNTPPVEGVKWDNSKQKWHASIQTKSHYTHIGYYLDRNKAIAALHSAGLRRGVEWRDNEQMWSAQTPTSPSLAPLRFFNTLPDALNAIQEAKDKMKPEPAHPGVKWSDSKQKWQAEHTIYGGKTNLGYYPDLDGAIAAIRAEEARIEELEYYRSLSWDKHHNMWKATVLFGKKHRIPTAVSFKTLDMAMTAWQEVRSKCAEPEPEPEPTQNAIDHGDKWQARISIDLEPFHLGFFPTPEEAETMYDGVKEKVLAIIQATVSQPSEPTAEATPVPPHWSEISKSWLCQIKIDGKIVSVGHAPTHKAAKIYTNTFFPEAP
jgi:hypothetical protein